MVKITVLSENTSGSIGLIGEWGLSMVVECSEKKILFDTGMHGQMVANADFLGIDLRSLDALVLSHGHCDHTGGMRAFLGRRGRLPVHAHPDLFALHYVSLPRERYAGIPFCQKELESLGADFLFGREPREIASGLWVSGEVPRGTPFETGDSRLICFRNASKEPDPLADDMSLYCTTADGLVIILGCAHAGLVNIIRHARQVTGVERVYGIIGGTHLGAVSDAQREATLDFLKQLNLQFLAANHCTGLPVIARLATLFGSSFHFAPAGTCYTLPIGEES